MKHSNALNVIIAGAVIFAVGIFTTTIGEKCGGNFFRALENTGVEYGVTPDKKDKKSTPYDYGYGDSQNGKDGNSNKSYGSSDDMDDMREFFRQFGMDDEAIDQFLNPSQGSGGGSYYYNDGSSRGNNGNHIYY